MLNILCEVASEQAAVIAGGIVAGMVVLKGSGFAWNQIRRRNGRDCCHGEGCERLARVETRQESFEKWLEKVEAKLDRVLERPG